MGDSLSEWKSQSSTVDFTRGSVQVKKKKKKLHASLSLINKFTGKKMYCFLRR